MKTRIQFALCILLLLTATLASAQTAEQRDKELLQVRREVWLAWIAGDIDRLKELMPADTVVMSANEPAWKHQQDVLQESREFHANGGKLIRLEFTRTEVQHFGDVAIVWSDYELELEAGGKKTASKGRVTEIFVRRKGKWTNPGWHTEEPK